MIPTLNKRPGEVRRAQRVFREIADKDPFGHMHLHAQLRNGNLYAIAMLHKRGVKWDRVHGAIITGSSTLDTN